MAENVITLKEKNDSPNDKVESFMLRNRVVIISCAVVLAVAAVLVCVIVGISDSRKKKALAELDSIEYAFTKASGSLSDEEADLRRDKAMESLSPYLLKGGAAGSRANLLAADIAFQRKDYETASAYYIAAAEASKKSYNTPLCYYNAAVCEEELGNISAAAGYYKTASEAKDFLLVTHSLFSLGRVCEELGDFAGAGSAYQKLADNYPSDEWAKLAQSRLIFLRTEGSL